MKTWEEIRQLRTDMSQYVLHCTKGRRDEAGRLLAPAETVFGEILSDGFLRATFAVTMSLFTWKSKPTVRGPHPAVCFTEQPLKFFAQTLLATSGDRYSQFAVAVRKDDLFGYGGRPVIYDNRAVLGSVVDEDGAPDEALVHKGGLPRDQQYRWVGYDPTALWNRDYPIDWTHEREWRVKPDESRNLEAGLGSESASAVPMLLPTLRPDCPTNKARRFILLVDTEQNRNDLLQWVETNGAQIADRGDYWQNYSAELRNAPVLSFEEIAKQPIDGLGRLEDFYPLSVTDEA